MKKRILLMTAIAGLGYLTLTSESTGPAASGNNRCGVLGGTITSCGPGGCHGTGAGPTVTITVDSASTTTAVTHYIPGKLYTIKIHGAGTTNSFFGFQFAAASGTGASQVQAGTFSSLPAGVAAHTLFGSSSTIQFVEHTTPQAATSAGVYDVSFQWTAPSASVGTVTMYCSLNAVNHNTIADNGDLSGNASLSLPLMPGLNVSSVTEDKLEAKAFPNPLVGSNLNISLSNAKQGACALKVYDFSGRCIAIETIDVNSLNFMKVINTSTWATGLYEVVVENNGSMQIIPVVKQ